MLIHITLAKLDDELVEVLHSRGFVLQQDIMRSIRKDSLFNTDTELKTALATMLNHTAKDDTVVTNMYGKYFDKVDAYVVPTYNIELGDELNAVQDNLMRGVLAQEDKFSEDATFIKVDSREELLNLFDGSVIDDGSEDPLGLKDSYYVPSVDQVLPQRGKK